MKATYTWLIYSCLFFGSAILCDRKNEKRQAVSSCSVDTKDKFYCSNGLCIEWSWVCDGRKDCSDGSDETKELCARYEYGTNESTSCGKVNVNNEELIGNGEKSIVEALPWKVGLYEFADSLFYMICGGTIIAPNVVISAAQCFWERGLSSEELSAKNRQTKVVVGKFDRNVTVNITKQSINVVDNDFVQIMKVENVYMKEGYNGFRGFFAEDIAVIVLAGNILFRNGVAPVCIDWNSIYNVKNGDQGKIVVRGSKNGTEGPVLFENFFQYISPTTCRKSYSDGFQKFLTFDKFCTNNTLEQTMVNENTGSGISFLHDNSYYLTGILSITNKLENDSVLGFTDIKYYLQWIRVLLNKHFTANSCVLPTVEGVVYSYVGSNKTISHGTLINHNLTIVENCEVGYHKAYPNGFRVCLGKGKWLFNFEKLCFKMCPPLESDSLDIECRHNGKYANCSNLLIPGTIAKPSCKPSYYYTAPSGQDVNPSELLCQSNGAWNKQLNICTPYCGRVYIVNQVLIENGEKAPVGTAPWNVGIYKLNKKNSNHDFICGGSIISPNLVVSAAHCFWQKGMLSKKISINDGLFKIAVGKYARNFSVVDNDFTKIINVEMIHLNEGYYGPTGFHAEDIAVIVLQNRVSFSNGVAPVCIDWYGGYNVVNGDLGKIVGWGKTEEGISSPILLEAFLPYIDHNSCRSMYTNGFEPYVTSDKFCAGSASVSGQTVGKGDSGAGLCFNHSDSYYLTGVVSIKDPNTHNSIAVFTEIKYHIQWIRTLYNKYN